MCKLLSIVLKENILNYYPVLNVTSLVNGVKENDLIKAQIISKLMHTETQFGNGN